MNVVGQKDILKERGLFIISTHVSYLDGVILGTLVPGSFTTKSSVKNTPFLGKVVSVGGSIFIDRQQKNHIIDYIKTMVDHLTNGINVFNFPEGHATDGSKILPFFSAFFDAPLKAKSSIVPITINYSKVNGDTEFERDKVYCYGGENSIIKHLWNLMKLKRIDVVVTIHDKILHDGYPANSKSRKIISELCLKEISGYKNLPVSDEALHERFSDLPSKA